MLGEVFSLSVGRSIGRSVCEAQRPKKWPRDGRKTVSRADDTTAMAERLGSVWRRPPSVVIPPNAGRSA
jgi:hypothetical protein